MLLWIAAILFVLWFFGLLGHIGGDFIHLVLVIALIMFIYDVLVARRRRV